MKDKHFEILIGLVVTVAIGIGVVMAGQSQAQGSSSEGSLAPQADVGTVFTYQGQLVTAAGPVTDTCDFQFALYDAAEGGSPVIIIPQTVTGVDVIGGVFSVQLDFGFFPFLGQARWLEIAVRCPTGSGAYETLSPRQLLTPAPYALYARMAPWSGLTGVPADLLDGDDVGSDWALAGNGGTTYGSDFIGTTDGVSLTVKVSDTVALRIAPSVGGGTPNIIGGYSGNIISDFVQGGTISGGGNSIGGSPLWLNRVYDDYGTIGGGRGNRAGSDDADSTNALYATIGGGDGNKASADYATVAGGKYNYATGDYATVGGGYWNDATADYATIPGGSDNNAEGKYSFAAGRGAKANNDGCFVWGDSTHDAVSCDNNNRWVARASGGVYFYTKGDLSSGMYLAAGGSAWNAVSDRARKENFAPVDTQLLLERLAETPITTWNYKAQDSSILHVGPMAQDFNALIAGLGGEGEAYINTLDADGVALAAIQGLYAQAQEQQAQIDALEEENVALEARLDALEAAMQSDAAPIHWADRLAQFWPALGLTLAVGIVWKKRH